MPESSSSRCTGRLRPSTAFMRRWTMRPCVAGARRVAARWCDRSWPIIRAWYCCLSLYLMLGRPMHRRFRGVLLEFQATALLLQERTPESGCVVPRARHAAISGSRACADAAAGSPVRVLPSANAASPEVQLLSNGRYHVMVTNAGGGYSRWRDFAITRWREDCTRDNWGSFLYLRDTASGQYWSAAHQPTLEPADSYEVMFSESRAEFRRRDHDCETYSEIVVSPEDDIELRRVRITNHSRVRRSIEVTSFAEVVLAPPVADAIQPSFGNLFVQTSIQRDRQAILCTRRPRSLDEHSPWGCVHLMAVHGAGICGTMSYETDRLQLHWPRPHSSRPDPTGRSPGRSRAAKALCSIRLSPSGVESRSIRKSRPRLIWCPESATPATSAWG